MRTIVKVLMAAGAGGAIYALTRKRTTSESELLAHASVLERSRELTDAAEEAPVRALLLDGDQIAEWEGEEGDALAWRPIAQWVAEPGHYLLRVTARTTAKERLAVEQKLAGVGAALDLVSDKDARLVQLLASREFDVS